MAPHIARGVGFALVTIAGAVVIASLVFKTAGVAAWAVATFLIAGAVSLFAIAANGAASKRRRR